MAFSVKKCRGGHIRGNFEEIGRGAWRERGEIKEGAVSLKMRLVWPENVNFQRKMAVFGRSDC